MQRPERRGELSGGYRFDFGQVEELCKAASEQSGKDVRVANYLCKGNYAVSGAVEAIEKVEEIAKPEFKAKMAVRLSVAGAFHTDFMKPAVEKLEKQLADTPITATRIPVSSNVDMQPHTDADSIRKTLATPSNDPGMRRKHGKLMKKVWKVERKSDRGKSSRASSRESIGSCRWKITSSKRKLLLHRRVCE